MYGRYYYVFVVSCFLFLLTLNHWIQVHFRPEKIQKTAWKSLGYSGALVRWYLLVMSHGSSWIYVQIFLCWGENKEVYKMPSYQANYIDLFGRWRCKIKSRLSFSNHSRINELCVTSDINTCDCSVAALGKVGAPAIQGVTNKHNTAWNIQNDADFELNRFNLHNVFGWRPGC